MEQRINIQWYPGHMTKTRRMMEADLKLVDAVCEMLDAQDPVVQPESGYRRHLRATSRGWSFSTGRTWRTRCMTQRRWRTISAAQGLAGSGDGLQSPDRGVAALQSRRCARLLAETVWSATRAKGQAGRRAAGSWWWGIPNVGKSTLINQVAGRQGRQGGEPPGRHPGQAVGQYGPAICCSWIRRASSGPSLRTRRWGMIA